MTKDIGDHERFLRAVDIVRLLSYFMAVWVFLDQFVMSQEALYASFLTSEAGYTISQAYEAVAPPVAVVGWIGLVISLLFADACYRAGSKFSAELRRLGITWAILTVIVVLLSPMAFSTLNSGLLAYPDGTFGAPLSTGTTFLYLIRYGASFIPLFPLTVVSCAFKIALVLELTVAAGTMGQRTGIVFLRYGAVVVFLGLVLWLFAVIGFLFFAAGLGKIAVEGENAYRHPRQE